MNMIADVGSTPETASLPREAQRADPVADLRDTGAYGANHDLGWLAYNASVGLRGALAGNLDSAADALALMLVALDQVTLGRGSFANASLLLMLRDPLAEFLNRRPRAPTQQFRQYSRLADQSWVTGTLQYVFQMDTINRPREEQLGRNQQQQQQPRWARGRGAQDAENEEHPLPKGKGKKKE